jgi:hypothetical protein
MRNKDMAISVKPLMRSIQDSIRTYVEYYHDFDYLEWYFKYSKKLSKFKDIHKGEDCFIIGNGPSLKKMNLSDLKNHHTFGLNKIYLLFNKFDLNLSYHVTVNPYVIEQSVKQFEELNCPSFLSFRVSQKIIRHLSHINFIMTSGPYTFQTDIQRPIFEGYTVTYVAMQIAFYMGFQRIFLIGVDHNFVAQGSPNDLQILKGDDPNHFSPNYFSNQKWQLPDLEASELSYNLARFFYSRNGRQIYDATIDGKLEIFPKITFEEAVSTCSKKGIKF